MASSSTPRIRVQSITEFDAASAGTVTAGVVVLAYSGAMACKAALEAVESRVPVSPAKPTMADLHLPPVVAGACILFPEQPIADRACPRYQAADGEQTLAYRLDERDQTAGSRASDLVIAGTGVVMHRTAPFARSEPDSASRWPDDLGRPGRLTIAQVRLAHSSKFASEEC